LSISLISEVQPRVRTGRGWSGKPAKLEFQEHVEPGIERVRVSGWFQERGGNDTPVMAALKAVTWCNFARKFTTNNGQLQNKSVAVL